MTPSRRARSGGARPGGVRAGGVRLAITVGDPAGIGPEIVSAALRVLPPAVETVRVYGDLDAVEQAGGLPRGIESVRVASAPVKPGCPDPAAACGVVEAIRAAARACLEGELDALVTAPISKEVLGRAGYTYPGHTELLAEIAGADRAVMLLTGGALRVVPATVHCALREVPARLAEADLPGLLVLLARELDERFGIAAPRLAVCGLNPHAGEGGRFGDEERTLIAPAIEQAVAQGVDARGPLSADSVFSRTLRGEFDVVVGMYHDQVLGPLKLHAFGRAVNVTLGLPLLRTSVDHGTAFELAGQGRADPGSMGEAVRLAVELVQRSRTRRGAGSDAPGDGVPTGGAA